MRRDAEVIVVGGGPAGMMAAIFAAREGASVLLMEKNESLGAKLLITGGGRCNVTNVAAEERGEGTRGLLRSFGDSAKFLHSAFAQWSVPDTIQFFEERGLPFHVEEGGRAFPVTNKAQSVWDVLVRAMKEAGVSIRTRNAVVGLLRGEYGVTGVRCADGTKLHAHTVILAAGGTSHPETGSTGDGFAFLRDLDLPVVEPSAALVPVMTREEWTHACPGTAIPLAGLTLLDPEEGKISKKGKLLFTHFGLSGPLALNMSAMIGRAVQRGDAQLFVDLFPGETEDVLDLRIRDALRAEPNKQSIRVLGSLVTARFMTEVCVLLGIDPETPAHSFTKEMRHALVSFVKAIPLTPTGLLGPEKAIIASGGVPLPSLDTRTFASRTYPNLHIIGDLLDITRPSGGFSLQLCWTTGVAAGRAAGKSSREKNTSPESGL